MKMKRRVKPFNELSRWQRNRRIRQSIDKDIFENYNFEEENNIDQVKNLSTHSQSIEFNDDMQYSSDDSINDCNNVQDVEEESNSIENAIDNDYETITVKDRN